MEPQRRLAEPFYIPGSSIGCLLIHGFTGSPSEMKFLGERLAESGYSVLGIRLSGHGTTPEEMAKTGWQDWVNDARVGIAKLRKQCKSVIAIGLSMGGLIALHLAAKNEIDVVISLNAPMILKDWRTRFVRFYKPFIEYVEKPASHNSGVPSEERFVYGRVPVVCMDSLNNSIREVRGELGDISCPALLMQSLKDQTVTPESVEVIRSELKHTEPKLIYWENSGHILTLGPERVKVADEIRNYIQDSGF